MAEREDKVHTKRVRQRIRVSQLVTRLENNALGELESPMTPDQIRSADIVLRKAMPDLRAVEHTDGDGRPLMPVYHFHVPGPEPDAGTD